MAKERQWKKRSLTSYRAWPVGRRCSVIETIELTVNDKTVRLRVENERPLLWIIRIDLGLTGTKFGCGEGHCGACTVLVNEKSVRSCQTTPKEVAGKRVLTVEGLAQNGRLHPLQKAFVENDALQCGFCTPGMLMSAYALLKENPTPTRADIIQGLDDNLCRCGTQRRVILAVENAARMMAGGRGR
jgi:aerobic-type carbon monoxide dehydrogenase small subunit (CoxS/CutS family)